MQQTESQGDTAAEALDHSPTDAEMNELIDCWIELLQSDGPAMFKLRSLELIENPTRLPDMLNELTADMTLLALATDLPCQRALTRMITDGARSGAEQTTDESSAPGSRRKRRDAPPDWIGLRAKWNDDGGSS